jgi:riboflavin biosynthesis pyrimidine reductase
VRRLWPEPGDLNEEQVRAAYAQPPGVRVNFISSADGAATLGGRSGGLGNAQDQRLMGILRQASDVVLVGAGTIRGEDYGMVEPRLAIVSRSLDIDPERFHDAIIVTAAATPAGRRKAFRDVIVCGEESIDVPAMLAAFERRGLRKVLCEGGPRLLGSLQAAGAVGELCLTLSPILAGPGSPRITAGEPTVPRRMRLAHVLTDDELLFLRYAALS